MKKQEFVFYSREGVIKGAGLTHNGVEHMTYDIRHGLNTTVVVISETTADPDGIDSMQLSVEMEISIAHELTVDCKFEDNGYMKYFAIKNTDLVTIFN